MEKTVLAKNSLSTIQICRNEEGKHVFEMKVDRHVTPEGVERSMLFTSEFTIKSLINFSDKLIKYIEENEVL